MSRNSWFVVSALLATVCNFPLCAQPAAGIPGVVAAGVQPQLVQEGFVFTEGPVGSADGGLYFTDVQAKKIYRLDPAGKITAIRENTERILELLEHQSSAAPEARMPNPSGG